MKMYNIYLSFVIIGQVFFIAELASIFLLYQLFNTEYIYFEAINYFLLFAIQIILILTFLVYLKNSRLKFTLPILLIPVIGQIMEGIYALMITKGQRKIRLTVIYYALFIISVIASRYVYVPPGFPAPLSALQTFGITLAISDVFNALLLIYLFVLFRIWDKQ
ncbi:hypothetical protein [Acidianus brierleyi]|uniref:Uncharacterized protein n=1 Tax=Acidianus brierleyi TaxID=41673 RepID=A0A2U9IHU5_9CREN|nr:hypothetical protein [Acidianus brierleyi]AWR95571.1 hypothetical protein DFR85_14205 [Acidianus brierleyi]